MKNSNLHIFKWISLVLLTVSILVASKGIPYVSITQKEHKASDQKTKEQSEKNEQVSISNGLEAIVASTLNPDFAKYLFFDSFHFSNININATVLTKRVVAEKYFRTLFTHIISPNAP